MRPVNGNKGLLLELPTIQMTTLDVEAGVKEEMTKAAVEEEVVLVVVAEIKGQETEVTLVKIVTGTNIDEVNRTVAEEMTLKDQVHVEKEGRHLHPHRIETPDLIEEMTTEERT